MRILEVIEARVWLNAINGRRVSPYGALPWVGGPQPNEWALISEGWTWAMDNNTIGMCRVPAKTREEAEAVMRENNARIDAAALASLPDMIECNKVAVADAKAYLAEANYPAAKRSAKRRLKEVQARLAGCEARLASLLAV